MDQKLTYRQQQFLGQFLGLYREVRQPLPYAAIAGRMGVGKITAYEMLRLLEKRGLVAAEYQSGSDQRGPGRPAVLFSPTQAAERPLEGLADWVSLKEDILSQLRAGQVEGNAALLSDLLVRLPNRRSPLILLTEMITSVLLALASVKDSSEAGAVLEQLRHIGLSEGVSLGVFSGISMSLSAVGRVSGRPAAVLSTQIRRYEDALSSLNDESRRLLGEYTREAVRILLAGSSAG